MMPDAEVLKVASEILSDLPIGPFTIKLNHRKLLDAVLDICGVPAAKFRPICSAIDKLDKEPWSAVREEMISEKGLSPESADRIGTLVQLQGKPKELHARLTSEGLFGAHPGAAAALAELAQLFNYLEAFGCLSSVTFDLSLARGLDYYTGVIYEAVLLDTSIGVGSIAAGGRYDNLVGMFASAGTVVPCVGVSIGIERVFAIMEAKQAAAGGLKRTPVSVLVASIPSTRGMDMTRERMRTCADIWTAGISAEMVYAADPKLQKQMTAALEAGTPCMVILAEDELEKGEVQVKNMVARTAVNVKREELVRTLLDMGVGPRAGAGAGAGASASASSTAAAAVGAAAAAPPPPPPPPSAAGAAAGGAGAASGSEAGPGGSVGVVVEGGDRTSGRFSRPARDIQ